MTELSRLFDIIDQLTKLTVYHHRTPEGFQHLGTLVVPSNSLMQIPIPNLKRAPSPQQKPVIPPSDSIHGAMPSSSPGWGGGGSIAPVLKFNGNGEYAGLLYHSPHSVVYEEDLYPTALHLFEARKFLHHRPDLAEQIRRCERVEEVIAISAQLVEFTRHDWGDVAHRTVSNRVSPCAYILLDLC